MIYWNQVADFSELSIDIYQIYQRYQLIYIFQTQCTLIYPERAVPYADALPGLAGPGRHPLRQAHAIYNLSCRSAPEGGREIARDQKHRRELIQNLRVTQNAILNPIPAQTALGTET